MGPFDIKDLLKLDKIYGKKLLLITYYTAIVFAVINLLYQFVHGLFMIFRDSLILGGLWTIFTSPFILVFEILIIRVVAEALAVLFDSQNK